MTDMDEVDQAPALLAFEVTPYGGIFKKTVPQCHTCMSVYRQFIEEQYVMGRKAQEIIELLTTREGESPGITVDALNRHFLKRHCTTQQALRLAPQWLKAAEEGLDPHDFEEVNNSSVAIVKLLVAKIREDILSGTLGLDSKDALQVLRMNYEMEQSSGVKTDYGADDIYVAVSVFMAHVQAVFARFIPMDQNEAMEYFRRLVSQDPIIKSIIEQTRQYEDSVEDDIFDIDDGGEGEDVVDAEIVTEVVDVPPAIEYTQPGNEEEFVDPTAEWE